MLERFLKKNANLFVSIGFFIALAGYFFDSPSDSKTEIKMLLNLGAVSCIAISILISLLVIRKLFQDPSGKTISFKFTDFNVENVERVFFAIPFSSIILSSSDLL